MSLITSVIYNLQASDICQTAGKGTQQSLSLATHLKAKAFSTYRSVESLKIVGKNSNGADLGSADINISSNRLTGSATHSPDWLRAVARMFNHLADNMDRLPTHEQTIATMVANRM